MEQMPLKIKNKLRQYSKAINKANQLGIEVKELLESYGMDLDYFTACADEWEDGSFATVKNVQTEALTCIDQSEGNIEDNIQKIEEVFLYHVNKINIET